MPSACGVGANEDSHAARGHVTVTAGSNKVILQGDGATGPPGSPFSLGTTFIGVNAQYISVIYTDASGVETVLNPSQYALALTPGNPPNWGYGGTVTYPLTGPAITVGTWLTVVRTLPLAQAITLQNQASYGAYASAAETALDLETLELQQVNGTFSRAVVAPPTDPDANLVIPNYIARALQLLGFDGSGLPIAAQPSSALVSTVMQPVVAASTLAAARAAMGIDISTLLPIGMEVWWPGLGPAPSLWLYEDGSNISRTTYSLLFNAIAPNLAAVVTNTLNTVTGIADTTGWSTGWAVEGVGIPGGTTIASVGVGTISLSNPATANGTSIRVFPFSNGNGSSTFTLPGPQGRTVASLDAAGSILANASAIGENQGTATVTLTTDELAVHTHVNVLGTQQHSHLVDRVNGGAGLGVANATLGGGPVNVVSVNAGTPSSLLAENAATGLTLTNAAAGSGNPHANVQPTTIRRLMIYAGA